MNIFYVDHNPFVAAHMLCDKHVVKMILETAQLLSTAHHLCGSKQDGLYRPTHINHPSAVWVRESRQHYWWTFKHFCGLLTEYNWRYGKTHASSRLLEQLRKTPCGIHDAGFTPPPQCMPDAYKCEDTVLAYQNYYKGEKAYMATWKHTPAPVWWPTNGIAIAA